MEVIIELFFFKFHLFFYKYIFLPFLCTYLLIVINIEEPFCGIIIIIIIIINIIIIIVIIIIIIIIIITSVKSYLSVMLYV